MLLEMAQKRLSDATFDDTHGKEVEDWMGTVRSRFEKFCSRLNEYENNLSSISGRKSELNKTVNSNCFLTVLLFIGRSIGSFFLWSALLFFSSAGYRLPKHVS